MYATRVTWSVHGKHIVDTSYDVHENFAIRTTAQEPFISICWWFYSLYVSLKKIRWDEMHTTIIYMKRETITFTSRNAFRFSYCFMMESCYVYEYVFIFDKSGVHAKKYNMAVSGFSSSLTTLSYCQLFFLEIVELIWWVQLQLFRVKKNCTSCLDVDFFSYILRTSTLRKKGRTTRFILPCSSWRRFSVCRRK